MGTRKQKKSKTEVVAEVTALNRAELKSKQASQKSENLDKKPKQKPPAQPADSKTWLSAYIKEGEETKSSAKLVAYLFAREEGASIEECSERAKELGAFKHSKWGTPSNIRSHISFLKTKGVQFSEKDGIYKIVLQKPHL